MSAIIYLEGGASGPDSKEMQIRCREGFRKLLEKCGYRGRMPSLSACGGGGSVFADFQIAHANKNAGDYVAMWIDSEEPMADIDASWSHLKNVQTVPQWDRPAGASDEQVLFMNTCMETWILADRNTLKEHYGSDLHESALPSLVDLEKRGRHEVQDKLDRATRDCSNAYCKGKRSYVILGKLEPATLAQHLPSFLRVRKILNQKL